VTDHSLDLYQDDGGWNYGVCECGWRTPPVPGADIVAESYAEHRLAAATVPSEETNT
jgi:hypothetical protein